jgi:hypothetical protein
MPKKKTGMNRHQKAVYRVGEKHTSSEEITELLELSRSPEIEDRLIAAEHLCPCHVRTRIPAVWEALFRMMEDSEPRVRQQAWHTIEDGGKPTDEEAITTLERICANETDGKVRRFAELTLDKVLGPRKHQELARLKIAHIEAPKERGKCDFCGETGVFVELDLQTMIPNGAMPRAARICARCQQAG